MIYDITFSQVQVLIYSHLECAIVSLQAYHKYQLCEGQRGPFFELVTEMLIKFSGCFRSCSFVRFTSNQFRLCDDVGAPSGIQVSTVFVSFFFL